MATRKTTAGKGPQAVPGSLQRLHPPLRIDALLLFLAADGMQALPSIGVGEPGEPSICQHRPWSSHPSGLSYRTPPAHPGRPGPQLRGAHRHLVLGNVALSSPVSTASTTAAKPKKKKRAPTGMGRGDDACACSHRPIRGCRDGPRRIHPSPPQPPGIHPSSSAPVCMHGRRRHDVKCRARLLLPACQPKQLG